MIYGLIGAYIVLRVLAHQHSNPNRRHRRH